MNNHAVVPADRGEALNALGKERAIDHRRVAARREAGSRGRNGDAEHPILVRSLFLPRFDEAVHEHGCKVVHP